MRSNGGLEDRKRTGCEFVLFELCDLELTVCEGSVYGSRGRMRLERNVRELVARLCQQFPITKLASLQTDDHIVLTESLRPP
jgi:hypothetical protein